MPVSIYSALTALGMAAYGLTDVGEVLVAVNAINAAGPSYESYADTFLSWGDGLAQRAQQATDAGHQGRNRTASSPVLHASVSRT